MLRTTKWLPMLVALAVTLFLSGCGKWEERHSELKDRIDKLDSRIMKLENLALKDTIEKLKTEDERLAGLIETNRQLIDKNNAANFMVGAYWVAPVNNGQGGRCAGAVGKASCDGRGRCIEGHSIHLGGESLPDGPIGLFVCRK